MKQILRIALWITLGWFLAGDAKLTKTLPVITDDMPYGWYQGDCCQQVIDAVDDLIGIEI